MFSCKFCECFFKNTFLRNTSGQLFLKMRNLSTMSWYMITLAVSYTESLKNNWCNALSLLRKRKTRCSYQVWTNQWFIPKMPLNLDPGRALAEFKTLLLLFSLPKFSSTVFLVRLKCFLCFLWAVWGLQ